MKMKKTISVLISAMLMMGCSGASAQPSATAQVNAVKAEYEALNGTVNSAGKENRTVTIPEDAPFVLVSPEEIVKKAEAKENFYAVYSDPLCPWCRSVIEAACESAKENHIDTIYMVDIWDGDGNEIFRDKYQIKEGAIVKVQDGTEAYKKTLELFGSVLGDYSITDENGTSYSVGEKRIFAPNFIHIKNGSAIALTEGISDLQKDAREELTDEIKQDEKKILDQFFQG
jgi:hypothetical protein